MRFTTFRLHTHPPKLPLRSTHCTQTRTMARHPEFTQLEASRPPFDAEKSWTFTQVPDIHWKVGTGANNDEWKKHKKVELNPYEEGRPAVNNYKTLISAITPRPIGFVSSISKNGKRNLAPFSYFNMANHDPPIFTLGFAAVGDNKKDSCNNILETGEFTINIISEWFVEAANYCAINSPPGVDEWKLSGLTPVESKLVKPPHVAESAFSIEAKLVAHHVWKSKTDPTRDTGVLVIAEGLTFHVREDVINEEKTQLDVSKLKPVSRLGGITYGRTVEGYEKPRPNYAVEIEKPEVKELLEGQRDSCL